MRRLDKKATGKNLRRLFIARGLTTKDVSEKLGYGATTVVLNWTGGKTAPRIDNLVALSDMLGVKIEDIIVTTGNPDGPITGFKGEVTPDDLRELHDRIAEVRDDIDRLSSALGRFAK